VASTIRRRVSAAAAARYHLRAALVLRHAEGSVTITVGDEVVELVPGQHAFGPRNIPHRFDVGPDGARMLWVLTPGGFEDFVEEASVPAETLTVPPADLAPPDGVEEIVRKYGNELL